MPNVNVTPTRDDLFDFWLKQQLPAGVSAGTSAVTPGANATPGVYNSESVGAVGSSTAPGAGAAVATIASGNLPAGLYAVEVIAHTTATAGAAAEDNNLELRVAAVVKTRVGLSRQNNTPIATRAHVRVDGTQAISVNATAAATAAVVYLVNMTAKKVSD